VRDPRLKAPLTVLLALLLHTLVLSRLRVAGVTPDLMLLLAVAGGITGGPERGAVLGFVSGLVIDLFLQTPLGLSALVFSVVGYAVGTVHTGVLRSAWWIPVLTALVASAAGEALYALSGTVVGQPRLVTVRLLVIVGVVGLLNAVLAPLAVRVVGWSLASRPASRYL
jgi:rod shape-determining protein MreD